MSIVIPKRRIAVLQSNRDGKSWKQNQGWPNWRSISGSEIVNDLLFAVVARTRTIRVCTVCAVYRWPSNSNTNYASLPRNWTKFLLGRSASVCMVFHRGFVQTNMTILVLRSDEFLGWAHTSLPEQAIEMNHRRARFL